MKFVTRATIVAGLGTALALTPVTAALAAEHDASVADGFTTISLDLGTEAASVSAGVVIMDIDGDAANPEDTDVVYANEVSLDELGMATMRISLPSTELEGYRILANYPGGSLYSAPLVGSEPGDGDGDGGDGDGGDGSDDGNGGSDEGPGGGSGTPGGNGSEGSGTGAGGSNDQLSDTGASAGWITGVAIAGGLAVVAGGTLLALKRRQQ